MKLIHFLLFVTFISFEASALDVRLKDIARIEGVRENHLSGYGVVVGLLGTGDTKNYITNESLKNYLKNLGIASSKENSQYKNVASVLVTARIPAGVRSGDKIDVTVSSIGDAKSLEGGVLIQTPLKSINGDTYSVAAGVLSFGGKDHKLRYANRMASHNTGVVYKGGIVEKEIPSVVLDKNGRYKILLEELDFSTLHSVKEAIDQNLKLSTRVLSAQEIEVILPEASRENPLQVLSALENLTVTTSPKAKVVINERTGVIVMGSSVTVEEVAISKQGLNLVIKKSDKLYETDVRSAEGMVVVQEATRVSDLVDALNKMGASTKDIISILEALKRAGALHAEVLIQ
jgi:flagellar P-ring protein FlgI